MKLFRTILSILVPTLLAVTSVHAQDALTDEPSAGKKVGFVVAASIPDGVVLQVAYKFMPELTIRGGLGFMPSITVYQKRFDLGDLSDMSAYKEKLGYVPNLDTRFKYGNLNGSLLLDYHPWKNNFRITAGLYIGAPKIETRAQMINGSNGKSVMEADSPLDPDNMPKITVRNETDPSDAIVIQPSKDASIDATVALGRMLRPYLGIGYGYAVPNSRVSFFMDFGALLTGKARLSSPNILSGDPDGLVDYSETAQTVVYYAQVLPVLNLGISFSL